MLTTRPGFMDWLEAEVEKISDKKAKKEQELAVVNAAHANLLKKSGLENLEKTAAEFIARFDELTGVEKRNLIERMIQKIVVKQDNKIEPHVLWEPKQGVTRTTKSSISDRNGGVSLRYLNDFSSSHFCLVLRHITLLPCLEIAFSSIKNMWSKGYRQGK